MKEERLKEVLDILNQLTVELSESDNISIQLKDTRFNEFTVLSLNKNIVFNSIKLTQRSEIIVEANALRNSYKKDE